MQIGNVVNFPVINKRVVGKKHRDRIMAIAEETGVTFSPGFIEYMAAQNVSREIIMGKGKKQNSPSSGKNGRRGACFDLLA